MKDGGANNEISFADGVPSVEDILGLGATYREKFKILKAAARERRNRDPMLNAILSKDQPFSGKVDPETVLCLNSLARVSTKYRDQLRPQLASISPRYKKDGHVYVFRGDYPDLADKGLYSYGFFQTNLSLDQMLRELENEPINAHLRFRPITKLEEFMWIHSNGGYESFVSTTTSYDIARIHPKYQKNSGTVYVLRVPENQAFSNYASVVTGNEEEILVVDYILPNFIIGTINPHEHDRLDIRDFM